MQLEGRRDCSATRTGNQNRDSSWAVAGRVGKESRGVLARTRASRHKPSLTKLWEIPRGQREVRGTERGPSAEREKRGREKRRLLTSLSKFRHKVHGLFFLSFDTRSSQKKKKTGRREDEQGTGNLANAEKISNLATPREGFSSPGARPSLTDWPVPIKSRRTERISGKRPRAELRVVTRDSREDARPAQSALTELGSKERKEKGWSVTR